MDRIEVTFINSDGDEVTVQPPGRWEVCPRCGGNGTHVNPAIDGNGITREEMDELGPDFFEDYMTGVYDVTCEECGGKRVVWEIDWEQWEDADPATCAEYSDHLRAEAEYRSIVAAERRMGA